MKIVYRERPKVDDVLKKIDKFYKKGKNISFVSSLYNEEKQISECLGEIVFF